MTKHEAICTLSLMATELVGELAGTDSDESNAKLLKRYIDSVNMAISALRQQEHFREVTKKVEPLTLDELRKMDNQPVWIEDVGEYKWHGSGWAIVDREYCLVRKASNGNPAFFERYGKEWIAYRQKPEEDDHDERKENENV